MNNKFNKFYNKTIEERRAILKDAGLLDSEQGISLPDETANLMSENYIFNHEMPLGLAFNFKVDGKEYIVPMAIEEPSVVAAASNGAKTLGNFETENVEKAAIGQIVLNEIENIDEALSNLEESKDYLFKIAEENSQNMIKRGGGPRKIWFNSFEEGYLTLYLSVDTCDAMGANTVNTILEAISDKVEDITKGKFLLRIISNYAVESIVKAKVEVEMNKLHSDIDESRLIAKRIDQATKYADIDPFRAVTHNKGVMNGIDAVVVATGNDWRAVEAGVNAYAARNGRYQSITSWDYDEAKDLLIGQIELPMAVATVGGTISINDIAQWSLKTLGNPSAKELASIIASVGLAQNFSALRAIVTSGIQKGHMSLQAKTVAKQAGASDEEMDELVARLKQSDKISQTEAENILKDMRR